MTQEETLSLLRRPLRRDPSDSGTIVDNFGCPVIVIDVNRMLLSDDEADEVADILVEMINGDDE